MRHVLRSAASRSVISLPKPILYPCQNSLFRSTSLSTSHRPSTKTDQVSPTTLGNFDGSEIEQAGTISKSKAKKTASFRQSARQRRSARVKILRISERKWEIVNPVFKPEYYTSRKGVLDTRMFSFIQFITTPTSDTPGTALILQLEEKRYIIGNIHEGLQRACLHLGPRVFKSQDIFLTGRTEWQSNGGLMGMILTMADSAQARATAKANETSVKLENRRKYTDPGGKLPLNQSEGEDPTLRLHGGPNLLHTLATARSFIFRKGMPVKVLEHIEKKPAEDMAKENWEPTWSDSRIHVWAMPIESVGASDVKEDPRPGSSRKRSLREFMLGERPSQKDILDQWNVHSASADDQDEQDQRFREFAVSQMFSSAWSFDNLMQVPLRNVKAPAALFVRDPVTNELISYHGPTPGGSAPVPDIDVLMREAWPGVLIDHLPPTKRSSTAMSYIIRGHKVRGKFNTDAAKESKVPSGPLWAALASGSSVQSNDGVTITPEMVVGPSKQGHGIAVIDLPSSDYVHNLVHRPEWRAAKIMTGVLAVIWILGPGVVQDKTLLKFIESQPGVKHIISSPDCCPNYLAMMSAASTAVRHHQIDPARYAIPVHNNANNNATSPMPRISSDTEQTLPDPLPDLAQPAMRGLRILLSPKLDISTEFVVPALNTALVVQETSKSVLELSNTARKQISSPAVQAEALSQNLPSPNAEIICLGTGSAAPSPDRNVSATLLRVPGCGSYLMDCGENTLGQLKRMYTAPELAEVFQDLKVIWISHLHADHHLGIASVIKAWYKEVHGKNEIQRQRPTITESMLNPSKFLDEGKRLFIVGHANMMKWLDEYSSVEEFGHDQLVPLVSIPVNAKVSESSNLEWNGTNIGFNAKDQKIQSAIRKATGLSNLVSCGVMHCWGAQAVSLTFPTGFKFSYSGDSRPSKTFANIGKHSTVLLHEATFDDELKDEALAKKHSTTSEAVAVGVAMRARRIILTHFSKRYQNIPSTSALDTRGVEMEDAEEIDDPSSGMDQPVDESISPASPPSPTTSRTTIDNLLNVIDDTPSRPPSESQPQPHTGAMTSPSSSSTNALAQILASNINPTPRPALNDMRIGVAFDHMRVKVRDIMHLDRFTPALMELYKETSEGGKNKKAAKETPLDNDGNDTLQKEERDVKKNNKDQRTPEELAEKARKGQLKAARRRADKEKMQREKKEAGGRRQERREEEEMDDAMGEPVLMEEEVEERFGAMLGRSRDPF